MGRTAMRPYTNGRFAARRRVLVDNEWLNRAGHRALCDLDQVFVQGRWRLAVCRGRNACLWHAGVSDASGREHGSACERNDAQNDLEDRFELRTQTGRNAAQNDSEDCFALRTRPGSCERSARIASLRSTLLAPACRKLQLRSWTPSSPRHSRSVRQT
jgi:hypothetical protein